MLRHLISTPSSAAAADNDDNGVVGSFMRDTWQKQACFYPHEDPSWLFDIFCLTDLEVLWMATLHHVNQSSSNSGAGGFLMFSATGVQTTKSLNPFFAFANRCSVVVNRGDQFSAKIFSICEALQNEAPFFPMVCCNVYLTPPNAQSVPKHSDDRDVFILQVFGEKEWSVYNDPVGLPYRDEEVGKRCAVDESTLSDKKTFHLRQGDVLYMPRGVVHEACTNSGASSLHLTIALQTSDWDYATLLLASIKETLRSPAFAHSRQCCPLHALRGSNTEVAAQSMSSLLDKLVQMQSMRDFSVAQQQFAHRIEGMKQDRAAILEACAVCTAGAAPLLPTSLIMWNPLVSIDGLEELEEEDPTVPFMKYIVHCAREAPMGSSSAEPDHMRFGASEELMRVVRVLSKGHSKVPIEVRRLPMFDAIGRLCAAIVLINNLCCIRVT